MLYIIFALGVAALIYFVVIPAMKKKGNRNTDNGGNPNPGNNNPDNDSPSEFIRKKQKEVIDSLFIINTTQQGVTVPAQYQLPWKFLRSVDDAVTMAQRQAAEHGWPKTISHIRTKVYVFPDLQTEEEKLKYGPSFQAFFAPGDPYDGSTHDGEPNTPGGYVWAAEQVLSYTPAEIVVADYKKNWSNCKRAVFNGFDHVNLELNGLHTPEKRSHVNGSSFHPLIEVSGYNDNYPDDEV